MFGGVYQDRTVWLSGHTGFKGSWLAEWLLALGARVHGFALPPATDPALFDQLGLGARVHHEIGDVRDAAAVRRSIHEAQPDFVFHLAAQPLVRLSYEQPLETYATNVMGTANVLDALRSLQKPCAAVFVTTDKCYENREWVHGYREEDALGGHDPYSSSKAAAEIVIAAYRRSFFQNHPVRIASARAGNVIGGGDWARDRILPDCMRALAAGQGIRVRNPAATRPWQHVLEPLSGYLWLAACLGEPRLHRPGAELLCSAFNFGPGNSSNRSVQQLVTELLRHWPGHWEQQSDPNAAHEARRLHLSTDKAHSLLGWFPVWDFTETIARTVAWYYATRASGQPEEARAMTQQQITHYSQAAKSQGLSWAVPL